MQELFRALPSLLERFEGNDNVLRGFVFATWRRTAGEMLSGRTLPVGFASGRLTLAVEDETWRQHLEGLSGQMLYGLNAVLGQGVVKFIEFRVDETASAGLRDQRPATEGTPTFKVSREIELAASVIEDEAMREHFVAAAAAYLARSQEI
jgi:hypothetical protein